VFCDVSMEENIKNNSIFQNKSPLTNTKFLKNELNFSKIIILRFKISSEELPINHEIELLIHAFQHRYNQI
jgi:hypothetical protein